MATINRGVLGGFRGKIGNVIGSSWKGIDTMRSMPISVSNPRTNAQVSNRNRFSLLSSLLSSMLTTIVKPLNDRFAQKMSGYNAVSQRSKNAFDSAGAFVPAELILSRGKLGTTEILSINDNADNSIGIQWEPTINGDYQKSTDKAYAAVIKSDGTLVDIISGSVTRATGNAVTSHTDLIADGDTIHVYLSFISADGTVVGNSALKTFVLF